MDTRPWNNVEIASRFRALRERGRLTQSRLGEIINLSRQTVSEIENGHVTPHSSTWGRFAALEAKHNQPAIVFPEHWY
jgi:DNA-binding XRE family transcriptional regulator